MLAVYADTFGGDEWLANLRVGEVDSPEPGAGEAVVAVEAAALNHHDLWTLRGVASRPLERRQVLGCDAAGTITAYGGAEPAGAPPVGTRVVVHAVIGCGACFACLAGEELGCGNIAILSEPPLPGTLAERLVVPARNLVPLPDGVSAEAAACLPTAYLTAYRMLFTRAALRPGQSVLIQGAGGGVATAALLLGLAAGLTVYVTSRDAERRDGAVQRGAAAAFAPERGTSRELAALTGGGVDAVIETVGEATWDLSLRALRPGGTVVVAGSTTGPNPPSQLNRVFWRHLTIAGSSMGTRSELQLLVALCASGKLIPEIDSVRPLSQAADAFARLAAGDQRGKLVLTPGS